MSERDGGPAFPRPSTVGADGMIVDVLEPGMSLRDWFAGQALAGLLCKGVLEFTPGLEGRSGKYIQDSAYRLADSMLAVREAKAAKGE